MKFQGLQPDNPILRRELSHQQGIVPRWVWLIELPGVIAIVLIASPTLINQALFLPELAYYPPWYETLTTLLPLLWIIHLLAAIRAIMAGAWVTSRDPMKQLWEDIAITGVSKRQLILGKWWAALYRVRGWIVALGIIQIMIVPVFAIESNLSNYKFAIQTVSYFCNHPQGYTPCFQEAAPLMFSFPPTFNQTPVGTGMALGLTILEMLGCTAIGMAAGLVIPNNSIASILGIIFRIAPVGIFTFWPDYGNAAGFILWRWQEYTWFAFADGGSGAIMRLMTPHLVREPSAWLSFLAASGMLVGLLLLSLSVIWVVFWRRSFH